MQRKFKNILVTGGLGFIGSTFIRNLLNDTDMNIYNLDKFGYASESVAIENLLNKLPHKKNNYKFFRVDLNDYEETQNAIKEIKPDLVINFAAETHVDRSIEKPGEFVKSNIMGTFNLLQSSLIHFESLNDIDKNNFRFHHISTDEVYGSLDGDEMFTEKTSYSPRSPYSASKASSDHLVNAWYHTYGLPTLITNCSNNFGPWQYPEKLIPTIILKAISGQKIPIYGDGENIRDWLYIQDHINALLLVADKGLIGESYCIGGEGGINNIKLAEKVCLLLDHLKPSKISYSSLITFVKDRPGHDKKYAVDSSKIFNELGWVKEYSIDDGLKITVEWYLNNLEWCKKIMEKSGYLGQRIGLRRTN